MADNFEIRIKALVEGLANVHALATELQGVSNEGKKVSAPGLDKVGDQAKNATTEASALDATMGSLGKTLAGLVTVAAAFKFSEGLVNASIQFEKINNALTAATGSAQGAAAEYEFVRATANRLGLSLSDVAEQYAKLAAAARGTTLAGDATRNIFEAVSSASRVLGLSAAETGGALTAIQQIISKGTVSSEELKQQLGERLPGAFQIAARAMGVTTAELQKMLEGGLIPATEFLPKFAEELKKSFAGDVATAANGTQAAIERLKNTLFETQVSLAKGGFLDGVTQGIQGLSDALKSSDAQIALQTLSVTLGEVIGILGTLPNAFTSGGEGVGAFTRVVEGAALAVAAVQDGISITSAGFSELGALILSATSSILGGLGTVASTFGLTIGESITKVAASIQEQAVAAESAAKQTFDQFGSGNSALAATLEKLSQIEAKSRDVATASKEIGPALSEAERAANALTLSQENVSTILKNLKVDATQFGGEFSDAAKAAIQGLEKLTQQATATGAQIRAALENALGDAKTIGDIDRIREALIKAQDAGKITGAEVTRSLESIQDASIRVAGQIENGPLIESFKRVGVKSKQELDSIAVQAQVDYERISRSANVSVDAQIAAIKKLIDAQTAANGQASSGLTAQLAQLEARKASSEAATAEGFAVRQAARDKEDEKAANERLAESEKALAEAKKKQAEADAVAKDAAKAKEQGLKDFGAVITGIINSVESLSSKTAAAFDSAFGLPVKTAAGSVEALRASLKAVNEEIAFNRSGADAFGSANFAGLVKFNDQANILKQNFLEQAIAAKTLEARLGSLGDVSARNAASFLQIAENAKGAASSFTLLDQQQLAGLQGAIQSARDKVAQFNQDIANTIGKIRSIGDSLQDELDRARGNLRAIQDREFEKRRAELLALAQQAGNVGDADVQRSLSLLQQVQNEKLKKLAEEEAARKASSERLHADTLAKIEAQKAIERAKASEVIAGRPVSATPVTVSSAPQTTTQIINNNSFSFPLPGSSIEQFVQREVVPVLDNITRRSR
jgi:tape measure domain-containing protein